MSENLQYICWHVRASDSVSLNVLPIHRQHLALRCFMAFWAGCKVISLKIRKQSCQLDKSFWRISWERANIEAWVNLHQDTTQMIILKKSYVNLGGYSFLQCIVSGVVQPITLQSELSEKADGFSYLKKTCIKLKTRHWKGLSHTLTNSLMAASHGTVCDHIMILCFELLNISSTFHLFLVFSHWVLYCWNPYLIIQRASLLSISVFEYPYCYGRVSVT